jgi:uncharacterized membrane protein YgdD (TMEM256/DUF423 family)
LNKLTRLFVILGSLNAALSVILGAFGAHILEDQLSDKLMTTFQTGNQYHFFHALGLFAVAFIASQLTNSKLVKWSGWLMFAGIILFSGSLYVLSITGIKWLGAITPIGGIAFIGAWVILIIAALKA